MVYCNTRYRNHLFDISAIVGYNRDMRKRKAELRVRIDEGIYDTLKRIAQQEGRTISELVREAIADWLRKESQAENGT